MKKNKGLLLVPLAIGLVAQTTTGCITKKPNYTNQQTESSKTALVSEKVDTKYSLLNEEEILQDEYKKRQSLSKMGLTVDLGNIPNNKAETILQKFLELNPKVEKEQVEVVTSQISDKTAFIAAKKDGPYYGKLEINYAIKDSSLTSILKNTNLGFIHNYSESKIKNRLRSLNPGLATDELSILKANKTSAIVKVKTNSVIYHPNDSIAIKYTVPEFSIKDHLDTKTPLKVFGIKQDDIKFSLRKFNEKLTLKNLRIFNITEESFDIEATDESNEYISGEVVNIKLDKVRRWNISSFKGFRHKKDTYYKGFLDVYTEDQYGKMIGRYIEKSSYKEIGTLGVDYTLKFEDGRNSDERYLTVTALPNSFKIIGSYRILLKKPHISIESIVAAYPQAFYIPQQILNDSYNLGVYKQQVNFALKLYASEHCDLMFDIEQMLTNAEIDWLKINNNASNFYALKHDGEAYYKDIVFDIDARKYPQYKQIFDSTRIVISNIPAPLYSVTELNRVIRFDRVRVLSYIDSTGDREYPSVMYPDVTNNNNRPPQEHWETKKVRLASFDYKELFGYKTMDEFFKNYTINVSTLYKMNVWNNWGRRNNWLLRGGKFLDFKNFEVNISSTQQIIDESDRYDWRRPPDGYSWHTEAWQKTIGSTMGREGHEEVAGLSLYASHNPGTTTINIYCAVGTWYYSSKKLQTAAYSFATNQDVWLSKR